MVAILDVKGGGDIRSGKNSSCIVFGITIIGWDTRDGIIAVTIQDEQGVNAFHLADNSSQFIISGIDTLATIGRTRIGFIILRYSASTKAILNTNVPRTF